MQGSKDNKKDKASKFKGVYRSGKKWKAQIQVDGKQHYLGVFDSEVHAAIHYQHFAMQHNRLPVPTGVCAEDSDGVCGGVGEGVGEGGVGKSTVYIPYLKVLLGRALCMQAKLTLAYHEQALRGKPVAPSNFDEEAPDDSLQPAPAQLRYLAVHIHMLGQLCVGLESHNSGEEAFEK